MLYWLCYMLFILTFVAQAYFCVASWRKRQRTNGFYLFFWMLCGTFWAMGTLVCMNAYVPSWIKDVMDPVRMSAVVWTPVVMTIFALEYAGARKLINRVTLTLLCFIPVLSQLLLLSPWSELFIWTERPPLSAHFVSVKFSHGPWFTLHTITSMSLVLLAGAIFLLQVFKNRGLLRLQSVLVLTGYFFPVVGMLLTAYPPASIPRIDYSSLAFPLTAVCWYVALFRYKLLEVAPIAQARIVEVMQDAVIVLTPDHAVVDVNAAALELLDFDEHGQVLAQTLSDCWSHMPSELRALLDEGNARVEIEVIHPERGKRVLDVRHSLIERSRRRDPVGAILVMRDITEHVTLIEELDAYAQTVAHDLKNPLSAQRGYLEMVQEESEDILDEDLQQDLRKVSEITESMIAIVHELLLLASMRQHRQTIAPLPLDMRALIDHVKVRQALLLAPATLLEPESWPVAYGHAPWVEEVWANFMSNAIKYGGEPPHITLGHTVHPSRGVVEFWIKDNGQGLSFAQQATLFKAFSRLDVHRAIKGHGVGLSIVKRIVEHLHGEVGVESTPGEGARFWFTLPSSPDLDA